MPRGRGSQQFASGLRTMGGSGSRTRTHAQSVVSGDHAARMTARWVGSCRRVGEAARRRARGRWQVVTSTDGRTRTYLAHHTPRTTREPLSAHTGPHLHLHLLAGAPTTGHAARQSNSGHPCRPSIYVHTYRVHKLRQRHRRLQQAALGALLNYGPPRPEVAGVVVPSRGTQQGDQQALQLLHCHRPARCRRRPLAATAAAEAPPMAACRPSGEHRAL